LQVSRLREQTSAHASAEPLPTREEAALLERKHDLRLDLGQAHAVDQADELARNVAGVQVLDERAERRLRGKELE